jgi:hypothetical protein
MGGKMIFRLQWLMVMLDCQLEGIRLPVFMCVWGGVGIKLGPAFFERLTSWAVGYNEHLPIWHINQTNPKHQSSHTSPWPRMGPNS